MLAQLARRLGLAPAKPDTASQPMERDRAKAVAALNAIRARRNDEVARSCVKVDAALSRAANLRAQAEDAEGEAAIELGLRETRLAALAREERPLVAALRATSPDCVGDAIAEVDRLRGEVRVRGVVVPLRDGRTVGWDDAAQVQSFVGELARSRRELDALREEPLHEDELGRQVLEVLSRLDRARPGPIAVPKHYFDAAVEAHGSAEGLVAT